MKLDKLIEEMENEMTGLILWPEKSVQEVFEKVMDATGNPDELERLRTFYREMKFFCDIAMTSSVSPTPQAMATLYGYAKKGLEAEAQKIRPEIVPDKKRNTQKRRGNNDKT